MRRARLLAPPCRRAAHPRASASGLALHTALPMPSGQRQCVPSISGSDSPRRALLGFLSHVSFLQCLMSRAPHVPDGLYSLSMNPERKRARSRRDLADPSGSIWGGISLVGKPLTFWICLFTTTGKLKADCCGHSNNRAILNSMELVPVLEVEVEKSYWRPSLATRAVVLKCTVY